jgi:Xaa-Pro dipeptidase
MRAQEDAMTKSNSIFATRQNQLLAKLAEEKFDAAVINAGPSLRYLTGLEFHLMERPVVLFLKLGKSASMVLPGFESGKLAAIDFQLEPFTYGEDPANWGNSFSKAIEALDLTEDRICVEDTHLRFLELDYLQSAASKANFVSGANIIGSVRERKESEEIEAMRQAAQIAERALAKTLKTFKVGQTEKEISARLVQEILAAGSEPELPFFPIVAGGPNSANPHASISERPVNTGDLLLIDWGASVDGYFSDMTRTFAVGDIDAEFRQIYKAVQAGNAAGRNQVAPGQTCSSVDKATRDVIEATGYGEFFNHRTGHGLGLEAHEMPYIRAGNDKVLETGMTFTVEPGIYLEGRGGVRIEDNVAVSKDGADILTSYPRDLQSIG